MAKSKTTAKTPVHQWTHTSDKVLVLRFSDKDGKAYGDFQHPLTIGESVTAPDWKAEAACGNGIHGWAWGIGIGDGKDPEYTNALWQIYEVDPADIVRVESKVKFRTGVLMYSSPDWHGAFQMILSGQMAWVFHHSDGVASNSGDYGVASNSGYQGVASNSGTRGVASNSGDYGVASNSGDYGVASNSGSYGSSDTTAEGTAAIVTGLHGKAKAAAFGCVALAWWNETDERVEMRCAEIGKGKGKLKPDTWYKLDGAGKFVEVK